MVMGVMLLFSLPLMAQTGKEWDDVTVTQVNREVAHTLSIPYGSESDIENNLMEASPYFLSLNGVWKFKWVPDPSQKPIDFYVPSYDVSGWDDIEVPSVWQMYGIRHNKPWDKPLYVNTGYPFTYDPVTYSVMSDRPSDWTYNNLMKNPVGSYRREFVLPSGWSERTVYVRFNGVGHGYYLWVNGQYVGYSEDSYLPSEFDITPYLQSGKNVIAAQVYRFTSGSFLECQDYWRFTGIHRDVFLWSAPKTQIRDYFFTTDLDDTYMDARARVEIDLSGPELSQGKLDVRIMDKGQIVAEMIKPVSSIHKYVLYMDVTNPKKWNAETPYLYDLVLTLKDGSVTVAGGSGNTPAGEMTYRINPSTGDKVSILGYGCMRWPTVVKGGQDEIDQDMVNELVDYALAHGVNYFDTSPAYCKGRSEHATGIALSRYPRDKYFIATKLSNFSPDTWGREASIAMYHNSLKELQVDYLDYMLLHGIGMGGMEAMKGRYLDNGILDFLVSERAAGRIRNLGFSYHGDIEVFDYLLSRHDEIKWDFVQIQLNYVDWKHAKEVNSRNTDAEYLYGELVKRNIPAIIMEPLLGGRLSNVPNHIVSRLKQRRPEDSVASWAFRFAGSPEHVLTVLSGMTYMEHLQDNLRTYSPLVPLADEDKEFLEETAQLMLKYPTVPCNDCQYCMPCPYGIDIPSILIHYNKCVNEGNLPKSSQDENYRKARRAFLVGYDRSVPRLRQANHCIGCNQCVHHCPQNIKIPEVLHRIDRFAEQLKQGTL